MLRLIFMNYQLLIESYSSGSKLSQQEIELLFLELETQIININIYRFCILEPAPIPSAKFN